MDTAPKRKITHQCSRDCFTRRTKSGYRITVELECGHFETINATEARRGWIYCFDCYYQLKKQQKE